MPGAKRSPNIIFRFLAGRLRDAIPPPLTPPFSPSAEPRAGRRVPVSVRVYPRIAEQFGEGPSINLAGEPDGVALSVGGSGAPSHIP